MRKIWKTMLAMVLAFLLIAAGNHMTDIPFLRTVKAESVADSHAVYFYTLIPGKHLDDVGNADTKWNGMGVGSISGIASPVSYPSGTRICNNGILSDAYRLEMPQMYPDIAVEGKVYQWVATEAEAESYAGDRDGAYVITWMRLLVATGANAGNNGYNAPVVSYTNTFHGDGYITIYSATDCTVHFMVQEPGAEGFALDEKRSALVDIGTAVSELCVAIPDHKTVNGLDYEFDGWYYDMACTQPVSVTDIVSCNVNYYGRYLPRVPVVEEPVVFTADSAVKEYDGEPLTAGLKSVTGLAEGHSAEATILSAIKDAGSAENVIHSYIIRDGYGRDITEKYTNVTLVSGSLDITKRTVTMISADLSKIHDGQPLMGGTVLAEGFVEGEGATYTMTGSQTEVGSSTNSFTYVMNEGTNGDNYTVLCTFGILEVIPAPEEPEIPEASQEPEVPEAPVEPEIPEASQEPEIPEAPVEPELPEASQEPEIPEASVEPEIPEASQEPEIPEAPVEPEIPEASQEPEIPEAPVEPELPEASEEPEIPEASVEPEIPEVSQEPELKLIENTEVPLANQELEEEKEVNLTSPVLYSASGAVALVYLFAAGRKRRQIAKLREQLAKEQAKRKLNRRRSEDV